MLREVWANRGSWSPPKVFADKVVVRLDTANLSRRRLLFSFGQGSRKNRVGLGGHDEIVTV